jgi:hypothetical protein
MIRFPWHLTNGTCAIQDGTAGTAVNGMVPYTFANKTGLSAVPCRYEPVSASDALRMGREMGDVTIRFYLPSTVGNTAVVVNAQDKIVFGGVTYRAIGPGEVSAGDGGVIRVICGRNT